MQVQTNESSLGEGQGRPGKGLARINTRESSCQFKLLVFSDYVLSVFVESHLMSLERLINELGSNFHYC